VTDRWAHQPRTVAATRAAYRAGARRILIVLPTGGGKTRLGRHYVDAYAGRGQRVLWVAHREELVAQAAATLAGVAGAVGVLQADRDPGDAPVVVASVQTLAARGAGRLPAADLVILDEAQNTTPEQMKMFLTRLGFGSTIVVTGDVTQVDLPGGTRSGLRVVREILQGVEDVEFCELTSRDVVRHPLVGRIVDAYGHYDDKLAISSERS